LKISRWPLPVAPQRICFPNREPSRYYRSSVQCVRAFSEQGKRKSGFTSNNQAIIPGDRIHALRGGAVGVLSRGSVVCPGLQPFGVCTPGPRDVLFPFWSILSHHLLP
jgi:hypothetical protein